MPEPSPVWSWVEAGSGMTLTSFELVKAHIFYDFFMTWQALSLSNVAKLLTQNSKLRGIWQAQSLSNVSKLWTQNSEFRAIWQALSLSNVPTLWAHNSKLRAQNSKLRAKELWWELNRVYFAESHTPWGPWELQELPTGPQGGNIYPIKFSP